MNAIELLKEARDASVKVLDGLNARIDRASKQGEPIPVYNGIVELHDIIGKIDSYLSALSTAEQERDALKARVAELEARLQGARWISVKERLPEGIVLCIDKIDHIFFAQCRGGQWSDSSVTYWMPLPEPPAIVGKKEG